MKFQKLDELYTYLRDKLVQKKEEKPRLIWRLRRVIEDDSYNNSELQSLSITIVCGSEVYENQLYQSQGIEKELEVKTAQKIQVIQDKILGKGYSYYDSEKEENAG